MFKHRIKLIDKSNQTVFSVHVDFFASRRAKEKKSKTIQET